jgi:hypothetical protein
MSIATSIDAGGSRPDSVAKRESDGLERGELERRELETGHIINENRNKEDNGNEKTVTPEDAWDWDTDSANPYNWPTSKKLWQIVMISLMAFTACVTWSILLYFPWLSG